MTDAPEGPGSPAGNLISPSLARLDTEPICPLEIALLGSCEVRLHGEPLEPLPPRKCQWLLALLVLRGEQPSERGWLAGCLWPENSSSRALFYLRRNLTELRRALGQEAIRLQAPTSQTIRFDSRGARVDVLRFDAAIRRGDRPSLDEAVRLYRGLLLPGCAEPWLLPERQAREEAYLATLETLAAQARAGGDPAAAARYLRLAVAVDPLRESAQSGLMEALAAAGDFAAATLVYRELRLLLHRELNTAPGTEIAALYERILARARERSETHSLAAGTAASHPSQPEAAERPPPSHLSRPISSFIGRDREILEIEAALASSPLVTLTGPGGVGKTRLAIQVGRRLRTEFPDGAWFVDLAALSDPDLLPQAVTHALGLAEPATGDPLDGLLAALHRKELLLVLDNCEHLVDACAALVDRLLSACDNLRVLATSRQPLRLAGEIVWRVPALALPSPGETGSDGSITPPDGPAAESESVRLFVARARAVDRSFTLTEQNAPVVADICRRLDGLPLAIELAAARLSVLTPAQLSDRLGAHPSLLAGGPRTAGPRQRTMEAAIGWSYDLLPEAEQTLLRHLAIFAGGFTLEAAETVCSDFGFWVLDFGLPAKSTPPDRRMPESLSEPIQNPKPKIQNSEVLDLLASLVEKSLVQRDDGADGARYRLLETVREYAGERLRRAGEQTDLAERHAAWATAFAELGEERLLGPEQSAWLDRLEAEIDNFRAAMEWCLGEGAPAHETGTRSGRPSTGELGGRLAAALGRFFHWRGYVTEGRRWVERALASPATTVSSMRAKLLLTAAALAHEQADVEHARRCAEEALALSRQLGDRRAEGRALEQLGHVVNLQGDYPRAAALFEESLALRRAVGDRAGIASSLKAVGYMAWFFGDRERAVALCEESLQLYREQQDDWGAAYALEFLGMSLTALDRVTEATETLHECLRLRRGLWDKRGVGAALLQLGYTCLGHDNAAARSCFEESLPLWRELGNPDGVATGLMGLGATARGLGDEALSIQYYREALLLFHQITHHACMAGCLDGMARTARRIGELRAAARLGGLTERMRAIGHVPVTAGAQGPLDEIRAAAVAALGEAAVAALWSEASGSSVEQIVSSALKETEPLTSREG